MPTVGDTFKLGPGGNYRLTAPIGKSSYGEIWSAIWLENQHPVAIKFIRSDNLEQAPEALRAGLAESLGKEIGLLRRVRAGHLLHLYRAGVVDGLPVMVVEQLSGTLHEHLKSAPRPGLPTLLEWLRQIAEGLRALHQLGWRHLDLKPHNLLLSSAHAGLPRLCIADFGASLHAATNLHPLAGTPGWQAPEQFFPESQGGSGYRYRTDPRADLYALGLLFFYMVTSRQTHFAAESLELHRLNPQHAAWARRQRLDADLQASDRRLFLEALGGAIPDTPDEAPTWRPGQAADPATATPPAVLGVLERLLRADPEERYPNVDAVLTGLARCRIQGWDGKTTRSHGPRILDNCGK